MSSSDEEWMPFLAIGRAALLARSPQPPPMPRQVGRGCGRGRAQLLPPPPGLAAIHCLPSAEVDPASPLNFRGGFEVSPMPMDPAPPRVVAKDSPSSLMIVRYGFPAEIERTCTLSPPRSEPRSAGPASIDEEGV